MDLTINPSQTPTPAESWAAFRFFLTPLRTINRTSCARIGEDACVVHEVPVTPAGDPPTLAAFAAVMLCWLVFGIFFLVRTLQRPRRQETRRNPRSILGMVLQGAGYFVMWVFFRRDRGPIVSMPMALDVTVAIIAVALAVGSVWLVIVAVRTLGKQWALAARLVEGHKLIVDGPYRWVRNPIYAGMLGMLLATGLVATQWLAFMAATVIFFVGTVIRVRSEETLLRQEFGPEFDAYARRVPALIPGLY